MGKRVKIKSDPSKARPHKKGAVVHWLQPAVHDQYGLIYAYRSHHFVHHAKLADESYQVLKQLHGDVLKIPVSDGARHIEDAALIQQIYQAGSTMAVNAIQAVQHFVLEIEMHTQTYRDDSEELSVRLTAACKLIGLGDVTKDPNFAKLIELQKIRDALAHPKPKNVYTGDKNKWDEVPLAWFVTHRSLEAYQGYEALMNKIYLHWEKVKSSYDQPGKIDVERGIVSDHQAKKPPKGAAGKVTQVERLIVSNPRPDKPSK